MTQDTAVWIQAGAAAVQALAAVLVAVLTGVLIKVTNEYVATTKQQVDASEAQLAELRDARAASVRPHLHVAAAEVSGRLADRPSGVRFTIINLGGGPAVDLRPENREGFSCQPDKAAIAAHEQESLQLGVRMPSKTMNAKSEIALVYRDMDGNRWRTSISFDLDRQTAEERVTDILTQRA